MLPNAAPPEVNVTDQQPLLEDHIRRDDTQNAEPNAPVTNWSRSLLSWLWRPQGSQPEGPSTVLSTRPPSSSSNDAHQPLLSSRVSSATTSHPEPIHRNLSSHSIDAIPSSLPSSTSTNPAIPLPVVSQHTLRVTSEIAASAHSRTSSLDSSPGGVAAKVSPRTFSSTSQQSIPRTNSSSSSPQCLICLEPLTADDFESGEAMVLECLCKGDNALRHRSCALKWLEFKGDRTCDVCKTPVGNLPDPPPRPATPSHAIILQMPEPLDDIVDSLSPPEAAAAADHVFDTIRVTWVAMIFCILFFQMSVGQSFLIGAAVGILYTTVCMVVHRHCQQYAAQQEQAQQIAS